jgi:cytochrome c oxidase subunit 3
MALAVHAAREGNNSRIVCLLGITVLMGVAFLIIKGFEYSDDL